MPRPNRTSHLERGTTRSGSARVGLVVVLVALPVATLACLPALLHLVVTSDSVHYLATANNLVHGQGFATGLSRPATSWMPLYPMLLAGAIALTGSMTGAAVVVNLLAAAAIFILTWLLVRTWRGRVDWFTWFAAGATTLSPAIFRQTLFALSETAFAALVLLLIYAATRSEKDRRWLWGVAVAGAAVALTRHVGMFALLGVGVAWRKPRYWLALLPGVVATVLWVLLAGTGDQASGFSVHRGIEGLGLSLWGTAAIIGGWPMFGLAVLALALSRKLRGLPVNALLAALAMLVFTALGGFYYVAGDLQGRMQIATQVLLVPCLLTAAATISADRVFRWAVYAGFSAFILQNAIGVLNPLYFTSPVSFNTPLWRTRRSVVLIGRTPSNVDIYTNAPDGVWFATGRRTFDLRHTDGRTDLRPAVDKGGLVVYFKGLNRPNYVQPEFYKDRVLSDSAGTPRIDDTPEALIMWVSRAQ
jgi:hypothetical protein